MKLETPIIVQGPAFTDASGKITQPPPIKLDILKVLYIDSPYNKTLLVRIEGIPLPITLYSGAEYEQVGDWTQAQAEAKLKEILGPNPAEKLQALFPETIESKPNGPGAVLSKMIKSLGIGMSDNCACRRHAIEMNNKGNDWCEQNVDTIVGWLRDEAKRRNLPFVDMIGKVMVQRAIKKSRKLLANQPVPENDEDLDKE